MNVWGQDIRIVQSTDPNELRDVSCPRIVTPYGYSALGATCNFLPQTTVGRRVNNLGFSAKTCDPVRLDHRVQRKGCPRLALAPATVTTMDEKRGRFHAVADEAAVATTLGGEGCAHGV